MLQLHAIQLCSCRCSAVGAQSLPQRCQQSWTAMDQPSTESVMHAKDQADGHLSSISMGQLTTHEYACFQRMALVAAAIVHRLGFDATHSKKPSPACKVSLRALLTHLQDAGWLSSCQGGLALACMHDHDICLFLSGWHADLKMVCETCMAFSLCNHRAAVKLRHFWVPSLCQSSKASKEPSFDLDRCSCALNSDLPGWLWRQAVSK